MAGGHKHEAGQKNETLVGIGLDFPGHALLGIDAGLHEIPQRAMLLVTPKNVVEVEGQQFGGGAHAPRRRDPRGIRCPRGPPAQASG